MYLFYLNLVSLKVKGVKNVLHQRNNDNQKPLYYNEGKTVFIHTRTRLRELAQLY